MAMDILQGLKGAHFCANGRACIYMGVTPLGRHMFSDGSGWMLEVPDPVTGMPGWPTIDQVRAEMAAKRLILRADPLTDPIRRRARRAEPTREDLVKAKTKADAEKVRDRWYTLREDVLKKWDDGRRCALSRRGITEWFEENFDVAALIAEYGRIPSDRTFRTWIQTRGIPHDRRPADFASQSGIVPRRRKIDPVVLAIIRHFALLRQSKQFQFASTYFRKASDDVDRYIKGDKLEMFDFEKALEKPSHKVKMCTRRIFTKEVEKAKSAKALSIAINRAAARQRFGGGGVAQEPTRFLEYVQLDDTPFPMVFIIDPVRRFPVGVATVTIALCVFTRVIVGWDISFETPRHSTYMRTLLSTALPKEVPEAFASIPELAELGGKVVGHMILDNAKHQIARAAQDAGGDIGQAVRYAGVKEPTHKGHVESCLRTLQNMIREKLPAGTWDIPLMREFDLDPAKQAVATIENFRKIFGGIIADYHTTEHTGLGNRTPLDVWLEQRALHSLDWVRDPDHFERAIAEVHYPQFRGEGAVIEGLRYGSNGTDDRYPYSNEDFLHHFALARGESAITKKMTFDEVKIKVDPDNIARAWLFDEHLFEYIPIPCTKRRYAEGLPRWQHERLREFAKARGLAFEEERDMLKVREKFKRMFDDVLPEASLADRRAAALLFDSSEGRAYLGDSAEIIRVAGSPSGMENKIAHDLRTGTRRDGTRVPPRSSSRKGDRKGRGDRRDAPQAQPKTPGTPTPQEQERRQEAAYATRRLDIGWSDSGYE